MKRLYWTNPDACEVEVEIESIGDCTVKIEPIVFHPDEGGQPADKGKIGESDVLNVEIIEGRIVHILNKPLSDGKYIARVDRLHRLHVSRRHTAQHIISGIAEKRFDLKTVGVHIGLESCTVDFDKKIDWEIAQAIERDSMEVVTENIPVETVFNDTDVRTRFDLKEIESDMIRVVKIGDYDASACCGTHVRRTGDIGIIRILDLESKKNGTRVSFAAGPTAMGWVTVPACSAAWASRLISSGASGRGCSPASSLTSAPSCTATRTSARAAGSGTIAGYDAAGFCGVG